MSNTQPLGKEECPGHLQWSAFGATYPDTVCSSVLEWSDPADVPSTPTLCDADDEFHPKDIPCPFCDPTGFAHWLGVGDRKRWTWLDGSPVPKGIDIFFHDSKDLTATAVHSDNGEELIALMDGSEG